MSSQGTVTIGPTKTIGLLPVPKITPAIKQASAQKDGEGDEFKELRIVREVAIMLLLEHPHIASLYEVVLQDDHYYMFLEYVDGGQMLEYMITHGKLKEKHARRFMRQIISAIDYCHQNSIVHRDLKIENILIDKEGTIKLIDFGLSNMYAPTQQLQTFCGSLYFAAPELLSAKAYTGPEVDLWSLGVILYVLVCGKVPFDDVSMPVLHAKIKAGVVQYPSHLSESCKHLLSRLLVTQPSRRATMAELKSHAWVVEGYDGPPKNYMPTREEVKLPLDMEVVRRIKGFDFGPDANVAHEIEQHIRSTAMSNFECRSNPARRSWAPVEPRLSVYHLVKEKMERERREAASLARLAADSQADNAKRMSNLAVNSSDPAIISASSSSASVQESNFTHPIANPRVSVAKNFGQPSPSLDSPRPSIADQPYNPPNKSQETSSNLSKRPRGSSFSRLMKKISTSFTGAPAHPQALPAAAAPDVLDDNMVVPSIAPLPNASASGSTRPSASATPSLHSRPSTSSMFSNASEYSTVTTDTNMTASVPSIPEQSTPGRADARIETLPLKHLFSTSSHIMTTTTHSPAHIRHALIRALEAYSRLELVWLEVNAGFSCEFRRPSEDGQYQADEDTDVEGGETDTESRGNRYDNDEDDDEMDANRVMVPAVPAVPVIPAQGTSSSPTVPTPAPAASVQLPQAPRKNKEKGKTSWTRKLRKRSSSLWSLASLSSFASGTSVASNKSKALPESRSAGEYETEADGVVRMEISIVKVPLVHATYGVRFVRIRGDRAQFKEYTTDIIDAAHL
ncbi:uncharacterized protein EV422DRAFT_567593 [Fimicolochytrium jonesii]|uniref:uncharacterized protein n=1 Tax=Fimicolochytrium jonesii TaxID=1396493 RepID=UPI0022FF1FAF|nr:uncharacterized protein EV422DRAFT_567593 [Fimicolochytrium jonesii]KAI8820698.1 hypothetical protein EV422DRAFT_567593 [Fimicolochytrium jonesii]